MNAKILVILVLIMAQLGFSAIAPDPTAPSCCSNFGTCGQEGCGDTCYVCSGGGYDCTGNYGYDYSCFESGGPAKSVPPLALSVESSCSGNIVTVSQGGAHVVVVDNAAGGGVVASGDADTSSRQLNFSGCGMSVNIYASESGYASASMTETLVDCAQCATPQCTSDSDCPDSQVCTGQKCVAVECSCGVVTNHACQAYACCTDSQCPAGQTCQNHACASPPKATPQCTPPTCCTSDNQCSDKQDCLQVSGAPASTSAPGSCQDITGCGSVGNHKLAPYECGTDASCPSCPQGDTCVANQCVQSDLTGPASGFVGDNANVQATVQSTACPNCVIQITDPSGSTTSGQTDASGNFALKLAVPGNYTVALLQNGTVVKTIQVSALPKAALGNTPETTTTTGSNVVPIALGLILLIVIIGGLALYFRGKGEKS